MKLLTTIGIQRHSRIEGCFSLLILENSRMYTGQISIGNAGSHGSQKLIVSTISYTFVRIVEFRVSFWRITLWDELRSMYSFRYSGNSR